MTVSLCVSDASRSLPCSVFFRGQAAPAQTGQHFHACGGRVRALTTNAQFSNFNAITSPNRALSMPGTRSELNLVVATLIPCVDSLGLLGIRLNTDGELAIRIMAARMPRYQPRMMFELGYRQSGRSRGGVGRSQKRSGHELRHVCLPHTVWLWMLRHATWSRHRGGVHSCASTSREQPSPDMYP